MNRRENRLHARVGLDEPHERSPELLGESVPLARIAVEGRALLSIAGFPREHGDPDLLDITLERRLPNEEERQRGPGEREKGLEPAEPPGDESPGSDPEERGPKETRPEPSRARGAGTGCARASSGGFFGHSLPRGAEIEGNRKRWAFRATWIVHRDGHGLASRFAIWSCRRPLDPRTLFAVLCGPGRDRSGRNRRGVRRTGHRLPRIRGPGTVNS